MWSSHKCSQRWIPGSAMLPAVGGLPGATARQPHLSLILFPLFYTSNMIYTCVHPIRVFIFFKILFIFRQGKGERKRGRKTSMRGCFSHAPHRGMYPTGNQTGDPLVHRLELNPQSYSSQALVQCFYRQVGKISTSLCGD